MSEIEPRRVLLVDDHEVVRSGLRVFIELEDDFLVVGEAGTAASAVELAERLRPDLVLMDVRLPDGSGISACEEITGRFREVKVLILTSHPDPVLQSAAAAARAADYVLKDLHASELIDHMRKTLGGPTGWQPPDAGPEPKLERLSPQERIVAGHLAAGITNREIALRMELAEKTVKNYVSNVLAKLGMERRSEAAAYIARVRTVTGETAVPVRGSGVRPWGPK